MRTVYVVILAGLVLVISAISFAQESSMGGQTQGMGRGMGQGQQMMGGGMMMQRPNTQMESTSDGGIVILSGNKLQKYDKDLKLIKEVELKVEQKQPPKQ